MLKTDGNRAVVHVNFKIADHLVRHFVGGQNARDKHFKPTVYGASDEFHRWVLAGLLEGDGHWSHEEQRETLVSASADLAMFARRELEACGKAPVLRRFETRWWLDRSVRSEKSS